VIRCVVVTPSTQEPVSLADVKLWIKVDSTETADDDVVSTLLATARARIEECSGRAFIKNTFDAYLDCTPREQEIRLPRAPLVSVTSVTGFSNLDLSDTGGTAMSTSGYYVDTASEPGRIVLTGASAWPTSTRRANALIIRFIAGESSGSSGVQDRAKTEIKQLVAKLYEHRGDELETQKILQEYESAPTDLSLPEWG
jgi:uncharacterized phiE125 gp8 family phage protein